MTHVTSSLRSVAVLFPVVAVALLVFSGCGKPYKIKPLSGLDTFPVERAEDREIPIYSSPAPRDGIAYAVLQSRRVREKSQENIELLYDDIARAARDANADAVVDLQILPVRRRGWMSDPNTPFPSWKHGKWLEYVLRGTAIYYPEDEEALRQAIAAEAAAAEVAELDAEAQELLEEVAEGEAREQAYVDKEIARYEAEREAMKAEAAAAAAALEAELAAQEAEAAATEADGDLIAPEDLVPDNLPDTTPDAIDGPDDPATPPAPSELDSTDLIDDLSDPTDSQN